MGVVEGLTEFLPISSTGHLILAGALLGMDDAKAKVFDIAIQTGAIFAVIIVYWPKLRDTLLALPSSRQAQRFTLNVLIAFTPAVVLGLLFGKMIQEHLFIPVVVATSFVLGGFVILWAEKRPTSQTRIHSVDDMTALDALKLGLVQCLAMIPGTSRSGSTIIGGLLCGMSRACASQFTFYLAIPVMAGASLLKVVKFVLSGAVMTGTEIAVLVVGCVVAFVVSLAAIRFLMDYVKRHDFKFFGAYRIVLGIIVLAVAAATAIF